MNQNHHPGFFIDPNLCVTIIIWLGWLMVGLGLFKILLYLVGEFSPATWGRIKSPTFKKLLTGKGNRLLFGLGGLLTVLLGLGSIGIALVLRRISGLL